MKRSPIKRKPPKNKRVTLESGEEVMKLDPAYLAKVRALPCCLCEAYGEIQLSRTEAHHPIFERHSNEKVPDREAVPHCNGHHTGSRDTSKTAVHKDRDAYEQKYGTDRQWIAATQDKIERMET